MWTGMRSCCCTASRVRPQTGSSSLAGCPGPLDVVALDRPGYGTSHQAAGGFGYGARAVLAELDARGIGRAVLVGHSYGGGVALSVARAGPRAGRGAGPAGQRRPGLPDRVGLAAGRSGDRGGVRADGVVADALGGPRPAGRHHPAARPAVYGG